MKTLIKTINYFLAVFFALIAIAIAYAALPIFGNQSLIVRSGSMQPAIGVGDLIVVKTQRAFETPQAVIPRYKKGDTIAFKSQKDTKTLTTHRVANVEVNGNGIYYTTKGDANKDADKNLIAEKDIIGKSVVVIPALGKLLAFTKSNIGFPILVIFPAALVIILETIGIFREIKRQQRLIEIPTPKSNVIPLQVIIASLFSVLLIRSSFAYFSDTATSSNNTFTAAQTFASPSPSITPSPTATPQASPSPSPSPTTDHLVINEVMFDPPNTNTCGSENDAEWVEIYNPTLSAVNLDTWSVGDSNFTDDLPNVSIPAGGFAVVSDCAQSSFTSIWSLPIGTIYIDLSSAIGNGLNNGGEHMRLFNGVTLIDDVSYGSNTDAFSPSITAPVSDHSIERNPDGIDSNTSADFVDRTTPTPGS